MVLVLANAITAAALHFNHQSLRDSDNMKVQLDGFYYAEVLHIFIEWTNCHVCFFCKLIVLFIYVCNFCVEL